jgi:hypothetical protein
VRRIVVRLEGDMHIADVITRLETKAPDIVVEEICNIGVAEQQQLELAAGELKAPPRLSSRQPSDHPAQLTTPTNIECHHDDLGHRLIFWKTMDPYVYAPLPSDAHYIRLMRLLPGDAADEIACDLFDYQPQGAQSVAYEALSYVWGDSALVRRITVNGCCLNITASLDIALRRLRRQNSDRLLWVDAICINQTDLTERATQVERMAVVYALAGCVLVCLGSEKDGSNSAFEAIAEAVSENIDYCSSKALYGKRTFARARD